MFAGTVNTWPGIATDTRTANSLSMVCAAWGICLYRLSPLLAAVEQGIPGHNLLLGTEVDSGLRTKVHRASVWTRHPTRVGLES